MKHVYINSRLRHLLFAAKRKPPKQWLFSGGEPWLLLTPRRLERLAFRLGLDDTRVQDLFMQVRRWHPHPEEFCRALGQPECVQPDPGDYPMAICPYCDRLHYPHPEEALWPCAKCQEEAKRRENPGPGVLEDRRRDREMRQWLRETDPGAFDNDVLSPNWQYNKNRRLNRDWDRAVNRILVGCQYRTTAKEFACSVGLLHRKVAAHKNGYHYN